MDPSLGVDLYQYELIFCLRILPTLTLADENVCPQPTQRQNFSTSPGRQPDFDQYSAADPQHLVHFVT